MPDKNNSQRLSQLTLTLAAALLSINTISLEFARPLSASAAPKAIDWDKKLEKPRHLMETNNVEEAIKIYEEMLKKYPESAALHTEVGKCYKRRGKAALAKAEFKRATEVDTSYADGWYELASMYQSDKEYDLAADSFSKFVQMAPYSEKKDAVLDRIKFCKSQI